MSAVRRGGWGLVLLTALIFVFAAGGCSLFDKDAEGGKKIRAARKEYAKLDSARVVMTNLETGEIEQTFTFKYDEKDVLIYSYYGKSEQNEYAQYNNGAQCSTYENGELTVSYRGDKDFGLYTRELKHPQADEGLLVYQPSSIKKAEVSEEDGVTHIHYEYDAKKIGASVEKGEVTGFSTDYYFNGDELLYFVETTEAKEDGAEKVYAYRVDIKDRNAVEKVEDTTEKVLTARGISPTH
ncbi:MAG: hypothetical protein IJ737_07765 [Ruminococcus sp.]|nr:hypothetical protein [Ruminococcus sp.]